MFGSVILCALWSGVSYCYTVPCKVVSDIVYTGVCEVVLGIVLLCALWSVFHIVIQCIVK